MKKILLTAIFTILFTAALPAEEGYRVNYNFKPGQSFRFNMEIYLENTVYMEKPEEDTNARAAESMIQTMSLEMELKVLEIDFMDNYIIEEKITGLKLEMAEPVSLNIDLSDARERQRLSREEGFLPLIILFENPVTFAVSPAGEIYEYDLGDIKKLLTRNKQTAVLASIESLLDQMVENLFYDFPETPLKTGLTYERARISQYMPGMGTINTTGIFSLDTIEKSGSDKLFHFSAAGKSSFTQDPESAMKMTMDYIFPEGNFTFSLGDSMVRRGEASIKAGFTLKSGDMEFYMVMISKIRYKNLTNEDSNKTKNKEVTVDINISNFHLDALRRLPGYRKIREVYLYDLDRIAAIEDKNIRRETESLYPLSKFNKYTEQFSTLGKIHRVCIVVMNDTGYFFAYTDFEPDDFIPLLEDENIPYTLKNNRLAFDTEDDEAYGLYNNILVLADKNDPFPDIFASPPPNTIPALWMENSPNLEDFIFIVQKSEKKQGTEHSRLIRFKVYPDQDSFYNVFLVCRDLKEAERITQNIRDNVKPDKDKEFMFRREGLILEADIPRNASGLDLF